MKWLVAKNAKFWPNDFSFTLETFVCAYCALIYWTILKHNLSHLPYTPLFMNPTADLILIKTINFYNSFILICKHGFNLINNFNDNVKMKIKLFSLFIKMLNLLNANCLKQRLYGAMKVRSIVIMNICI